MVIKNIIRLNLDGPPCSVTQWKVHSRQTNQNKLNRALGRVQGRKYGGILVHNMYHQKHS